MGMREFVGLAKRVLRRSAERIRHLRKERAYWHGQMECWYREKYDLQLHPIQNDRASVPPPNLVAEIQPKAKANSVSFIASGQRLVMFYLRELNDHGFDPRSFERILDFGVGFGRLIRHYYPFSAELHGCDVTDSAVTYSRGCYGDRATLASNEPLPPLPYKDESFDYIYANSVFTHIQTDSLGVWIDELARIARPGSCVIVSVFSPAPYLSHLTEREFDRIETGDGYLEWGSSHVRQRLLFATAERHQQWWGSHFEVLEQRSHFKYQDHLVMRRLV